ncbi:olfactory receptor 1019-like [Pezoporus wallicus]|uniref:olfactory receptor 1019-like n=1 Tax=Pezoporus wallicus TaxID=35540 RepID=UPI00254C7F2D|nr:olfactory receptor 1019-like [Pezoporus wallicus]XP_061334192.1 olfactory receptor 5AR1-like [Pezoporus flaviventris]
MTPVNHTDVHEFILLGLTTHPDLQVPLFMAFLAMYMVTLLGNFGIIVLIRTDLHLHTPMYYFLSHLAFVDICYSSVIIPKMLVQILTLEKTISFSGCAAQLCFFVTFGVTECLLLAVMAYDRYVAICKPLLYPTIMCGWMCWWLVAGSYVVGVFHAVTHTTFIFTFSFCHSNVINHYFCDIAPLLALSCSNTHSYEGVILALVSINCLSTMTIIFISYAYILPSVLRIRSKESRRKAFSTCTSHLMVVTTFYGAILFMYLRPSSTFALDENKTATLFYTIMNPTLNPLIYSLRNREVKAALLRAVGRRQ